MYKEYFPNFNGCWNTDKDTFSCFRHFKIHFDQYKYSQTSVWESTYVDFIHHSYTLQLTIVPLTNNNTVDVFFCLSRMVFQRDWESIVCEGMRSITSLWNKKWHRSSNTGKHTNKMYNNRSRWLQLPHSQLFIFERQHSNFLGLFCICL